jgi:hypothetical protein
MGGFMFGIFGSRQETVLIAMAFVLLVFVTYFGYEPPYQHYLPMLAKARDPSVFPLDIHMQNSTYMRASIFYPFLRWTQLRIENDIIGLCLHVVVNSLLFCGAVMVLRRRLTDGDRMLALVAALVSCFFYTKLVEGARATPITFITPTPTGIGHAFGMAALFLALLRRPALAMVATTLCIAVAPKGNILLVPILTLWLLFDRTLPRRALAWALLPLAYVGYMAATTSSSIPPDQKLSMLEMLISREEEDGTFIYQPLLTNLLLPTAFLFAAWLSRKIADPTVRAMLWALIIPVAGGWLLMLVYPLGLHKLFAMPLLVMLSVPQSTKYFIWLTLTAGLVLALKDERLAWYEKLGVVMALLALRPFPLHAALAVAIGSAVAASWWIRRRRMIAASNRVSVTTVVPALLLALLAARIDTTYVGPSWIDRVGFAHSGSWSSMVFADDETWNAWESLRDRPDFQFLALYESQSRHSGGKGRLTFHPAANMAAGKSQFWSVAVHGYNDPKLMEEIMRRSEVVYDMTRRLGAGESMIGYRMGTVPASKEGVPVRIEQNVVEFLSERHMMLMLPNALSALFPADLPRRTIGTQTLIGFGMVP